MSPMPDQNAARETAKSPLSWNRTRASVLICNFAITPDVNLSRLLDRIENECQPDALSHPSADQQALQAMREQRSRDSANIVKLRTALNQIAHPSSYGAEGKDPKEIARIALLLGVAPSKLP